MVNRLIGLGLFVIVLLTAGQSCRGTDELKTKQKVQEAIVARLKAHSGLDLNSVDVNTTSISFDKNLAYATVAFHPKSDPAVNSGMSMKYTLEEKEGQWAVVSVGDSQGKGAGGHPDVHAGPAGEQLPPGHPALSEPPNK